PLITIFGICSYSIFIVGLIEMFTLLPLYVKNHLGMEGDVLGASKLMYGCGSLVSGFIISKLLKTMPIPKSIIILTFLTTVAFLLVAFTSEVWIYYAFSIVVGFTNSGSRIFRVSYLFSFVPNEITGRVNSMFNVYTTLIRIVLISLFALPFFTTGSNVRWAYFILGALTLTSAVILVLTYDRVDKLTQKPSLQNKEAEEEAVH
ncbi:MAG: MFS transporter, partial [Cytophagaceae bacterium]